jgi:hypothetical protein
MVCDILFLWIYHGVFSTLCCRVDDATRARIEYEMEEPGLNMIMTGGEQNHFIGYNCSPGPKRQG